MKHLKSLNYSLQRYLALYFSFNKRYAGHILMKSASLGSRNKHISFPQTFFWKPQKLKPQELRLFKVTKCNERSRLPHREARESPCQRLASLATSRKEAHTWHICQEAYWKSQLWYFRFETVSFSYSFQQLTLPTPSSDQISFSF